MSTVTELLKLVPAALDLVELLRTGQRDKAARKARIIAETLDIKATTRAVAKAVKR